jgi:hypothetical protein
MQNFKSYLAEKLATNFAPWHITDPEKVQYYMKNYANMSGWKVNKDGTVSVTKSDYSPNGVYGDIGGYGHGETALMVKYRTAKKFEINVADGSNFKSLWGIPDACDQLNISVPSLETLEHCTPVIKDSLYLYTPNLKSFDCGKVSIAQELKIGSIGKAPLRDLHKHFAVPQIRFYNTALHLIKQKPLLSLLKCNAKLTWGSIMTINGTSLTEVVEVLKILNKYNSSSIIQCQRELIEKDLDEYAEF